MTGVIPDARFLMKRVVPNPDRSRPPKKQSNDRMVSVLSPTTLVVANRLLT